MTQQPVMRMFICDCCSASDGAAEAAEREANILLQKEPRNWLARALLGLARLRLGRNKDALSAIRDLPVTGVEPPGRWQLAQQFWPLMVTTREPCATRASLAKPLLHEERALVSPLLE